MVASDALEAAIMLGGRPTVISERALHTWIATPAKLRLQRSSEQQQGGGA